jgi:LAO/AO transport system kinase
MEMADTIVINRQMAITFEGTTHRNQSSTEAYIYFQQKVHSYNCNLQCNYTRRIPEVWETITKFIELTKSNDYFNALNRTNDWMLEAINEQLKGNFITIPKYKTCWNQLKAVQNGEISPFAAAQLILEKYF